MSDTNVYTGRWTDWSKGSVRGDQYTMTTSHASILVAFIAIFIAVLGSTAWEAVAYIIHQLRVTRKPRDGMYHQSQALLRNHYSPLTFAQRIARTGLAWREHPGSSALRTSAGFALIAIIIYAAFIAAGLLLSRVASSGAVLLRSAHCGGFDLSFLNNATTADQIAFTLASNTWGTEQLTQSFDYAKICYPQLDEGYSSGSVSQAPASDCNFFVASTLNWTESYPGVCPFDGMCLGPTSNIVQFNTGLLDTHDDFGNNAQEADRLQFRRITTCAPVFIDGYQSFPFNDESVLGNETFYEYGPTFSLVDNAAWFRRNVSFVYSYASYVAADKPYTFYGVSTHGRNSENEQVWDANPNLQPNGTNTILLFLANRAAFLLPNEDPIFNASEVVPANNSLNVNTTDYYYTTQPASILGCSEEAQICNPNLASNQCMTWPNVADYALGRNSSNLDALNLNERQTSQLLLVARLLYDADFGNLATTLGANMLAASNYLLSDTVPISLPLPDDQWIVELRRLQATAMAVMQRAAYDNAAGPTDPTLTQHIVRPASMDWACDNQKFNSTAYASFSILGLGLIFGIGGLIIVLAAAITEVIPRMQKSSGKQKYAREQWYSSDLLRLQRIVYEDRGLGTWKGKIDEDDDDIPVTELEQVFPNFTDKPSVDSSTNSVNQETPVVYTDKVQNAYGFQAQQDLSSPIQDTSGRHGIVGETRVIR